MKYTKGISLLLASLLALVGCKDKDAFSSYYKKYIDAVADGAVERGWIHSFIPTTATEIYEDHTLDLNMQLLRFDFDPNDGKKLIHGFEKAPLMPSYFLKTNKDWWPRSMDGFDLYVHKSAEDQSGYLAIDWKLSRAFYWTTQRNVHGK